MIKKTLSAFLSAAFLLSATACAARRLPPEPASTDGRSGAETTDTETSATEGQSAVQAGERGDSVMLKMEIDGAPVEVEWEKNAAVNTLMEMCVDAPLEINLSAYGGFEQVGPIGASLPRSDSRTTTAAGDIVLYSGNQLVVFYGSNTWSYTRLGRISDKTPGELATMLGGDCVAVRLSLASED